MAIPAGQRHEPAQPDPAPADALSPLGRVLGHEPGCGKQPGRRARRRQSGAVCQRPGSPGADLRQAGPDAVHAAGHGAGGVRHGAGAHAGEGGADPRRAHPRDHRAGTGRRGEQAVCLVRSRAVGLCVDRAGASRGAARWPPGGGESAEARSGRAAALGPGGTAQLRAGRRPPDPGGPPRAVARLAQRVRQDPDAGAGLPRRGREPGALRTAPAAFRRLWCRSRSGTTAASAC